jgi:RNA polymerase sigma-70 factor (ECF subfamily)
MSEKDSKLIVKSSRGDRKAFESIVREYEKPIFNIAYRMTGNYEDAMDITQSVFVKAYEKFSTYDASRKLFSWLYKIAVNESINNINRGKRVQKLNPESAASQKGPEEHLSQVETGEQIQDALRALNLDYRLVLVLKHFLDLSYSEIGELLQIPEKTVKSRLFTGRQLLKDLLLKQGLRYD